MPRQIKVVDYFIPLDVRDVLRPQTEEEKAITKRALERAAKRMGETIDDEMMIALGCDPFEIRCRRAESRFFEGMRDAAT